MELDRPWLPWLLSQAEDADHLIALTGRVELTCDFLGTPCSDEHGGCEVVAIKDDAKQLHGFPRRIRRHEVREPPIVAGDVRKPQQAGCPAFADERVPSRRTVIFGSRGASHHRARSDGVHRPSR